MREVGFIPVTLNHMDADVSNESVPPPMIVDARHNLGFVIGNTRPTDDEPSAAFLGMYDLKSLRLVDRLDFRFESWDSKDIIRFTVDEGGERLLQPMKAGQLDPSCAGLPLIDAKRQLDTIEYGVINGIRKLRVGSPLPLPCPGAYRIFPKINSVYEDQTASPPTRKLYVYGTYVREFVREPIGTIGSGLEDNAGQPLVIQQIDLAKLEAGAGAQALDWQYDLRYAGCGRMGVPFVQRAGDSVFSYCFDTRPALARSGNLSEQGYVVRIPLDEHDQPAIVGGVRVPDPEDSTAPSAANFLVRRTPALAGAVVPFADPFTGTVLLLTNDAANGNATWVFDPIAERFVGVITGGYADQPPDKTAAGFDPARGRTYLFTSTGLLMAPTRQRPLPTGTIYDVVSRPDDHTLVPQIAVAPSLRRLFVPLAQDTDGRGRGGWVVIEDDVPDAPPPEPEDPDRNTAEIAETPSTTRVETRGAAAASGAHLLAVGGVTRTFDQTDPLCEEPAPGFVPVSERPNFDGRCLWDVLFASGNREMFFAGSAVEVGTATGAVAEGSGLAFAQSDHTDQDLKRASECHRSSAQDLVMGFLKVAGAAPEQASSFQPLYDQYEAVCAELQEGIVARGGPDLSAGTRGPDDKGFPVKRSECAAFDDAETDAQPPEFPLPFSSAVLCDPDAAKATADATSAAVALPSVDDAIVSVARMTSSVRSERTEQGQETTVSAIAEGVRIGPLRIGEVHTIATTRAKGRTGTAAAEIVRRWCRVQLEGAPPIEDCVDPTSPEIRALVDQVNQALGRVRIGVPDALVQATDGGYQAVVTKHPDVRAADEAVNDDDSHTVSGLQLVVYNDGPEGRNRLVLQLAGVHAESRYGIQPIPDLTSSTLERLPPLPGGPPLIGDLPPPAPPSPDGIVKRVVRTPVRALQKAAGWLVNNPREFALLFLLLAFLAAPAYLAVRRWLFERAVIS